MPHSDSPSEADELNPLWGALQGERAILRDSAGRFLARGKALILSEAGATFAPIPQEPFPIPHNGSSTLEIAGLRRPVKSIRAHPKGMAIIGFDLIF